MFTTLLAVSIVLFVAATVIGTIIPNNDQLAASLGRLSNRLDPSFRITNGSIQTLKSLLIGLCVAVGVGSALYFIVSVVVELSWLPRGSYWGMWLLNPLLSLLLSILAGTSLFSAGRFTVAPAQVAFASVFGIPITGAFRVGKGWLPPGVSQLATESSAGVEISPPLQKNMTADGFQVSWNGSFLLRVADAFKAQNVSKEDRMGFATNEFLNAGRYDLYKQTANVQHAFKGDITQDEASALLKNIAEFKGGMHIRGGGRIQRRANKALAAYGLAITEVQIKTIDFSNEVEAAADRILSEALQLSGLRKDAKNKAAVVHELMEIYKEAGVGFSKLTPEMQADYLDRMADRALAMEDKGKVTRINFGGSPPRGAFINLGNPGGNGT